MALVKGLAGIGGRSVAVVVLEESPASRGPSADTEIEGVGDLGSDVGGAACIASAVALTSADSRLGVSEAVKA